MTGPADREALAEFLQQADLDELEAESPAVAAASQRLDRATVRIVADRDDLAGFILDAHSTGNWDEAQAAATVTEERDQAIYERDTARAQVTT